MSTDILDLLGLVNEANRKVHAAYDKSVEIGAKAKEKLLHMSRELDKLSLDIQDEIHQKEEV